MKDAFIVVVAVNTVVFLIPIFWAALGEAITEQAGVLNVGIEGVMIGGAFAGAMGIKFAQSPWLGVVLAMVVGAACGALLAYLYVTRGTDQIVTGIMFTTLMLGLTSVMYDSWLSSVGSLVTFDDVRIPGLVEIPVAGPALFDQPILGYLAFLTAPAVFLLLRRTWFGLASSAIGRRPVVGEAAGVSVHGVRWAAVVSGCTLVAVGGASLVLIQTGGFVPGMTSGQGFIALVVVILARWNPIAIIAAAALFGVANALQFQLQTVDALQGVPRQAWLALPYIVTITAVAVTRRTRYPAGVGIPYRGQITG